MTTARLLSDTHTVTAAVDKRSSDVVQSLHDVAWHLVHCYITIETFHMCHSTSWLDRPHATSY